MAIRSVVVSTISLIITSVAPAVAATQPYPDKPVTIVAPFAPGASDIVARFLAQRVGKELNQQFLVENRPGANGQIGVEYVMRAMPDGNTLLFASASQMSINPQVKKMQYDPRRDFTNIILLGSTPGLIAVRASLGVNSTAELIKFAKSKSDPLKIGNAGTGSFSDLAVELFSQRTGISVLSVPFKGSRPAATAMEGGETDAQIGIYSNFVSGTQSGRIKVLAVAAPERLEIAPDIPTAAQAGLPDFEVFIWWGLYGPAGIPQPIVNKINTTMNSVLRSSDTRKYFSSQAARPLGGSTTDMTDYSDKEYRKWEEVIKAQNRNTK